MDYSLSTIRRKAYALNYQVVKGYQHFQNSVLHDTNGNRKSGYMVMNLRYGIYVYGCYNENYDFLWDLDDVVDFLKEQYEEHGLKW